MAPAVRPCSGPGLECASDGCPDSAHGSDRRRFARASLGLSTIAGCVETEEQLARIRSGGCASVQGFLFSRPVGPDQIDRLLAGFAGPSCPPDIGSTAEPDAASCVALAQPLRSPCAADDEIRSILAVARRRNAAITGGPMFGKGCSAQVPEGPMDAVTETFERTRQDERQRDVTVLRAGTIEVRDFPPSRWPAPGPTVGTILSATSAPATRLADRNYRTCCRR